MNRLISILILTLSLACHREADESISNNVVHEADYFGPRPDLGLAIGSPPSYWHQAIDSIHANNPDSQDSRNSAWFKFNYRGTSYETYIELNDILTYSNDIYDQELANINITFNNMSLDTLRMIMTDIYGYDSNQIISEKNAMIDSIQERFEGRTNPLTGGMLWDTFEKLPSDSDFISLVAQGYTSSLTAFSWSEVNGKSWSYKKGRVEVPYHFNDRRCFINLSINDLDPWLDKISKEKRANYTASNYMKCDVFLLSKTEGLYQFNPACKVDLEFVWGRNGAAFDKRKVTKVKYDFVVMDEFEDVLENYEGQILDLSQDPFSEGSYYLRHSAPKMSLTVRKRCTNYKFRVTVNSVILDDGSVIKHGYQ